MSIGGDFVMGQISARDVLVKVLGLKHRVTEKGMRMYNQWTDGDLTEYRESYNYEMVNMAMYLAFRSEDISLLQEELRLLGVSPFATIESDIMGTLDAITNNLSILTNMNPSLQIQPQFNSRGKNLKDNANEIFGRAPDSRNTRIMVTLPTEAGEDYNMIHNLIENGMSVARINCAHDNEKVWMNMIKFINHACEDLSKSCKITMELAGPKIRIDWIYSTMQKPILRVNDLFILTPERCIEDDSKLVLGCNIKEIFDYLNIGDPVLIDDGVIEGKIIEKKGNSFVVKVSRVHPKKNKVRSEKGLNFPESNITIPVLTDRDKEILEFVCEHADVIGCSFVKNREDIRSIVEAIKTHTERHIPLMLKIETVSGVQNLSELISEGSKYTTLSVMIARGDLAIEGGFLNLGKYQHEIMDLCESASVPVVWATQVLEGMCKNNIPTRAEITDVYEGGSRAECIMVNKGKYLVETIGFLNKLLVEAQSKHYKRMELYKQIINI